MTRAIRSYLRARKTGDMDLFWLWLKFTWQHDLVLILKCLLLSPYLIVILPIGFTGVICNWLDELLRDSLKPNWLIRMLPDEDYYIAKRNHVLRDYMRRNG